MSEFLFNNGEYILGAFTAIIIPSVIWLSNKVWEAIKRYQFKRMLYSQYVKPAEVNLKECKKPEDFTRESLGYGNIVSRLTYFKNEEIRYLNSGNQFYYIRSIEFTKSLFKLLSDEADKYEFKQPFPSEEDLKREEKFYKTKKSKMEEILETYKKSYHDYVNLKIDKLM